MLSSFQLTPVSAKFMPPSGPDRAEITAVPCADKQIEKKDTCRYEMTSGIDASLAWMETLSVPVFALDHSKRVIAWNGPMIRTTGVRLPDILNRQLVSILDDVSIQDITAAVSGVVAEANSTSCNIIVKPSKVSLSVRLSLSQSFNGQNSVIVCFAEENRKKPLPSHKMDFPWIQVDMDGTIKAWNSKVEALVGFQRDEMIGRDFLECIPDLRHQEDLENIFSDMQETSCPSKTCKVDMLQRGGNTRSVAITVAAERSQNSEMIGFCAIVSNASDLGEADNCESFSSPSTQHALHCSDGLAHELRQLFDNASTLIFGVDMTGCVNEWNNKTSEITGYTAQDALNQPFLDTFTTTNLQPGFQEVLRKALRGRGTSNFQLEMLSIDGEVRHLLLNAIPRRDRQNRVSGVRILAQDITESCKHDRAVAAMANELRKLIDTANAPIFGIDLDGNVNEWNNKTAEITGYTKEEVFDCSLVETIVVPAMRNSVKAVLNNALQGRGTSNYELEFRTKFNEIRHLLVNATTRRDAENNVVGVLGVAQDVTEAVQRDRAVAGMALELRQLIDTANAPIFGIDTDGNINEWNRRTSEITGYSKEEAFDEPLVETFIAKSMREKVQEILDAALEGNETSNYELEFVSKCGEPIVLLVNATTRRDPENQVVGVVGVAQDVTEDRKHAQALREMQYLRASQEAKVETERNMTAYFAHELRNPLGAIDSALNAMPDDLPESAKSLISGMQLCSGFMSSIMNNLLDVRKMEEGKMTLFKSPISLSKLLYNVHKMLKPSVRSGVNFLRVCKTNGKDWVLGDPHRVQQVMTNVVTNAIKYTVTGSITLSMGWEGDMVKFECIDTGPGIPKNEQEKLFQRFVQRGGAPGTGLGLAIAKHLVDLTGGSIRFDSDPTVRAGTTCVVQMRLPLCDAPENVREETTSLIQEPIRFLIIDDIKMNRMMLKRRIIKGIAPCAAIKEACTGEEALAICGKEKFDVIVVDQYMEEAGGVMLGTDVVFAMRRMRIDSVIVGCSGNDIGAQFFEAGADWVWQKPMPSNCKIIQDLKSSLRKRSAATE